MAGSALFEPVRSRFNALVAEMSPRDRALFVGLVLGAYFAAFFTAFWLATGILGDLRSRAALREDALARLTTLEAGYEANAGQVREIEATLRANASQDLPSFIEKAAGKAGVTDKLKGVREKAVDTEGNLEIKVYSIELDKVSLAETVDFLHETETGGYPLRIRTGRFKTTGAAGSRLLSVSLEAAAYRLTDEAPAAAPEGATP